MNDSCAALSSYSPLATVAITAGISAAVSSMATAAFFIMSRRRRKGRRRRRLDDEDDDDDDDIIDCNGGGYHAASKLSNRSHHVPPSNSNGNDVGGLSKKLLQLELEPDALELRASMATEFTCSSLSQDYPSQYPMPQQHPSHESAARPKTIESQESFTDTDQVSSLRDITRNISQRHYNAIHSTGRRLSGPNCNSSSHGEPQDDVNVTDSIPCECSCPACESCTAGQLRRDSLTVGSLDERRTLKDDFRPEAVVSRRRSRRATLSNISGLASREGSFLDDSTHSLFSSGTSRDDGYLLTSSLTKNNPYSRRLSRNEDFLTSSQTNLNLKEEDSYISETELKFKGEAGFDENVITGVKDLADSLRLLRQTRAISALSNRLMAAPDEATCIEEVTRLLVLMFGVDRVSFAMLTDSEHFLLKRVNVLRKDDQEATATSDHQKSSNKSSFELQYLDSDCQRPLEGTAAGACVKSLKEHYTPRTADSSFDTHKVFHRQGINTVLVTPILVNGGKCAGCILLSRKMEDGYKKADRILIGDIGLLLGANIYAKRLLKDAEETKRRSREMLHSFIPPKVLDKIECYWDANSDEYKSRKSKSLGSKDDSSLTADSMGSNTSSNGKKPRSNSWYVAQSDWSDAEIGLKHQESSGTGGVKEKIQLLKNMNRGDDDSEDDHMGVIVNTSEVDLVPTTRALYAENVQNVCIVFTDIVGFSLMSMDVTPTRIMDMLQNLFRRFDELCDVHGVLKLETIGDAYICATNLMEEDDDGVQDAAMRALAMAKDMIIESTNVKVPSSYDTYEQWKNSDTVQIRVGIHVGDVTCGVLGQRMPKFTTCGKAVNMAARMEQTSQPSCIRVSKDFHDVIGDAEKGWNPKEVLSLKNMGEMETYLLEPLEITLGI